MKNIGLLLAALTLILDQLSKYAAVKHLFVSIKVTDFLNLALVYNQGISFGFFKNISNSNYIFAGLSLVITIFLYNWLKASKKLHEIIALGLIIGGALGNVVDRFCYPGVVDFLEFHWKQYYWPSFNIADSAIFLGVCILMIFSIYSTSKDKRSRK